MQHVVGRPADPAGEVGDLDRRLAVQLALDVPVEHLRLVVREGRVEHLQLVGLGEEPQLDRGRVDQRVGPTELQRVDALLEGHLPGLPDQRQVFGVVDRQLDRVRGRAPSRDRRSSPGAKPAASSDRPPGAIATVAVADHVSLASRLDLGLLDRDVVLLGVAALVLERPRRAGRPSPPASPWPCTRPSGSRSSSPPARCGRRRGRRRCGGPPRRSASSCSCGSAGRRARGRPSRPRELLTSICDARLVHPPEDVGAVDLHPDVVPPGPQLDQLEDHLRVGAQVQLDLVADGDVLDRLGDQERQPVAAVLAEDPHHAIRQRRRAQLRLLVVGQQIHPDELVAVFRHAVAVLDLERHRLALEAPHPLRPAVGDRLGAFDGVDEVLAQAFLDDLLGLRRGGPAPAGGRLRHLSSITSLQAVSPELASRSSFSNLPTSCVRDPRQLGDLLDQVDLARPPAAPGRSRTPRPSC